MHAWRTSTLLFLCATGAAGCLAHERAATEADAGSAGADSEPPIRDVGPAIHDGSFGGRDATVHGPDGGTCQQDETSVGIRIEPITSDVARCVFTHADGVSITGIDVAVGDDGVRLHLDLCPGANADCRCDVVVTNVGSDIATTLGPDANVAIDIAPGEGFFPGAYLAITKVPTCECDGCGCSEPLFLYAANVPPDGAPHVPAPMTFANGFPVCNMIDCTFGGSSMLHARGDAGEMDVPGGTQVELGSVHVRSIRDVEVFAPCAACAGCDTPVGAWIAWVSSR